jgi:hypothetical protein
MQLVYDNGVLLPEIKIKLPSLREVLKLFMAGYSPDEGDNNSAAILWGRFLTDFTGNMELGLFTNVAPGQTITEATITEPSGVGYARIALTDGNWSGGATRSYPQQTFTAGGTWTGAVQGYFINTLGATKRLSIIEVDPNGPYNFILNDTYKITPVNTVA